MSAAKVLQAFEITLRWRVDAAGTHDRLGDDRRDVLGADAVGDAVRNVVDAVVRQPRCGLGYQRRRAVALAVERQAADAGAERVQAVVPVVATEDDRLRCPPGQLPVPAR